jgi:tetratricopeptide (TPR) repeat protein
MPRSIALYLIVLLLQAVPLFAEECSVATYDTLVTEGKKGDEAREWGKSVEAYSRILADCRTLVKDVDLVKAYDALSVAQLMQENYSGAVESAKRCIELDSSYNACMMTAAKSYENLGDRSIALEYAKSAVDVGAHDDYSSAVVIYAKDFLRRLEKK